MDLRTLSNAVVSPRDSAKRRTPRRARSGLGAVLALLVLSLALGACESGSVIPLFPALPGTGESREPGRWKIETGPEAGLVEVSADGLRADGWSAGTELRLSSAGEDVPLVRVTGADGATAGFVFYAAEHRTLYTDRHVYWLEEVSAERSTSVEKPSRSPVARRAVSVPGPESCLATVRAERQEYYAGGLLAAGRMEERWYYEKYALTAGKTIEETVTASAAVPGEAAELVVALRPFVTVAAAHRVEVSWNGVPLGEFSWSGVYRRHASFAVPPELILAGENTVSLTLPADSGGGGDHLLVDWFELSYQRRLVADGGRLTFRVAVSSGARILVGGFADASDVLVWDVTDPASPILLSAGPGGGEEPAGTVAFVSPEGGARRFHLAERAVAAGTSPLLREEPSAVPSCDYLIVAHPDLAEAVEPLAEAHRAEGMVVEIVTTEELYDRYNFGRFDPEAIRRGVQDARPSYLLLVGDTTFDYFGYTCSRAVNRLPSYLVNGRRYQIPSDNRFACLDDDDEAPDLAVGRLTAVNTTQVRSMVAKTLARIEDEGMGDSTIEHDLVLAAGSGSATETRSFERACEEACMLLGCDHERVERAYISTDGSGARQKLLDGINVGTRYVSYVGHSNHLSWANGQMLSFTDIAGLSNESYPVVIQMTCISGFFNLVDTDSIAEKMMKLRNKGAAATIASSGLVESNENILLGRSLYRKLAAGSTPGEALMQLKAEWAEAAAMFDNEIMLHSVRGLVLLGDPAIR